MAKQALPQKIVELAADPSWADRRLGEVLKTAAPFLSSRDRVLAVANGLVSVGGAAAEDLDRVLAPGEAIAIDLRHGVHGAGKPRRPPLKDQLRVHHDDDHLVVVAKSAGIVVDPQLEHSGPPPLVELLKHYWRAKKQPPCNPVLVQRLDKETSGLMVLAKTKDAARHLQRQLVECKLEKRYTALVEGSTGAERGVWRSYLGEGEDGMKQAVWPGPARPPRPGDPPDPEAPAGSKLAVTYYTAHKTPRPDVTKLMLRLETGRTHQIRIHCAEAGVPIVGDRVYSKLAERRNRSRKLCHADAPRLMLHAHRLKFQHPATARWLTFDEDCPPAFDEWLAGRT